MASSDAENPVWETVKTVVYALLIAGVFRAFLFQPFYIPSGSMKGTLLIGDFMFVNKFAYGYSAASCEIPLINVSFCPFIQGRVFGGTPERGDVVVFNHPVTGEDYIKRVIGLPGERIQMRNGVLYINGEAAVQQPQAPFVEAYAPQGASGRQPYCSNRVVGLGGDCEKVQFRELLPGGSSHLILNVSANRPGDNTDEFVVPDGHLFMMGDNRDNSIDSRFSRRMNGVGMVPIENVMGRADRVIFSSGGTRVLQFWTWRGDRFFREID